MFRSGHGDNIISHEVGDSWPGLPSTETIWRQFEARQQADLRGWTAAANSRTMALSMVAKQTWGRVAAVYQAGVVQRSVYSKSGQGQAADYTCSNNRRISDQQPCDKRNDCGVITPAGSLAFRRERHTSHHVAGCHLLTLFLSDPQPEQFDLLPSTESGRGLHPLFISSPPIPTVTLNTNSGLPIEHLIG